MRPLVSILIPCYNAAPWVGAALESALAQTWPNKEIILVNDGSRDDSLAIARTFESRGVRVIDQANRGQCAAFNCALREARGDFFEYLDADDLLAPDKIERQIAALQRAGPDAVATGAWGRFHDGPGDAVFVPTALWQDLNPIDWLLAAWNHSLMMHGAAWLVPRSIALCAGGWSEELSLINDLDYFTRILLQSKSVVFCREARTYYRSGLESNVASSRSPKACASAFASVDRAQRQLLATEDSPRTRQACANLLQYVIYWSYPESISLLPTAERRIRELGGANVAPEGGRTFQWLSRIAGWKFARRLQHLRAGLLRHSDGQH